MLIIITSLILGLLFLGGALLINIREWYFLVLAFFLGLISVFVLIVLAAIIANQFTSRKKVIIKPKKFYSWLIYVFCDFLVIFYRMKVIVEGYDLIKDLEGYELVSNHQSMLDPVIAINKTKRKDLSFIMKKEIMKSSFIGRFIFNAGSYPLDRSNARSGLMVIINGSKAIEAGRPIGVYIEGTRSKGPDLLPFHDGSLKMAMKAKKEIVVAVTDNTYMIKKRFPFRRTKILFKICKVYRFEEYQNKTTIELGDEIKNIMIDNLKEARIKYNNYK